MANPTEITRLVCLLCALAADPAAAQRLAHWRRCLVTAPPIARIVQSAATTLGLPLIAIARKLALALYHVGAHGEVFESARLFPGVPRAHTRAGRNVEVPVGRG